MSLFLKLIELAGVVILGSFAGSVVLSLLVNAFDPPLDGNKWEPYE